MDAVIEITRLRITRLRDYKFCGFAAKKIASELAQLAIFFAQKFVIS
jgi:hypothetical protein